MHVLAYLQKNRMENHLCILCRDPGLSPLCDRDFATDFAVRSVLSAFFFHLFLGLTLDILPLPLAF